MPNRKPITGVLQLLALLTIVWGLGMQVELMLFFDPVDPSTSMADLELANGIESFNSRLGAYPAAGVDLFEPGSEGKNVSGFCWDRELDNKALDATAKEICRYSRQLSAIRTNTLLDFIFIGLYASAFIYAVRLFGSWGPLLRRTAEIAVGVAALFDVVENIGLLRTVRYLEHGTVHLATRVIANTLAASRLKWVSLAFGIGFLGAILIKRRSQPDVGGQPYAKRFTIAGYLGLGSSILLMAGIVLRFVNAWVQVHYLIGAGVLSLLAVLVILSWPVEEGRASGQQMQVTGQPLDPMQQLATDYIYMLRGPSWGSQVVPDLNEKIEKGIQDLYESDFSNPPNGKAAVDNAVDIWKRQDERSIELLAIVLYHLPQLAQEVWSKIRASFPENADYVPTFIRCLASATYLVITQQIWRVPWKRRRYYEIGHFKGERQAVTRQLLDACAPKVTTSSSGLDQHRFCEELIPVLIEKPLFMQWLARAIGIAVPFTFVLDAEMEEIESSRRVRSQLDSDAYVAATQKMEAMLQRYEERADRRKKHRTVRAESQARSQTDPMGFSGVQGHSASTSETDSTIPKKMHTGVAHSDIYSNSEAAERQFLKKMNSRVSELARTKPPAVSAAASPSMPEALYKRTNRDGSGRREFPIRRALKNNLFGITFSGGGIRSATFNLGILQALAEADVLRHVDYLSAVSGGSYIAGWLGAWCKRQTDGIRRVQRWLAPWRSPDPRSQEVRPIWFLRQYSNYLTPNKSVLSADTWTAVSIWVRNTLLNQIIVLLVVISLLLIPWLILAFYETSYDPSLIMLAVCIVGLVSVLIGSGLSAFERDQFGRLRQTVLPRWCEGQSGVQVFIVLPLMMAALISAVVLSSTPTPAGTREWDWTQFGYASAGLLAPLLLAQVSGRFHRCFVEHETQEQPAVARAGAFLVVLLFAALAASVGAFLTVRLMSWIQNWSADYLITFAPPMFLLVFAATVTLHVGLLGINFPDERREWWARLAGWTTIYCVGWVVLFGISLFGTDIVESARWGWRLKSGAIVAWLGSTAWGLVKGYSSSTPAKEGSTSGTMAKIAMAVAPPIFIIGLLLVLSFATDKVLPERNFATSLSALAITAGTAIFISWRVDVNEFSMHHFYRNRLMRAYLGASHVSRMSNPFTGFDRTDDVQLSTLQTQAKVPNEDGTANEPKAQPYFGPYLLVNTALNIAGGSELAWQERKAQSFVFAPLYSGFEYVGEERVKNGNLEPFGYRPTEDYGYRGGVGLCTSMAISGAAVNPNMGYHSSPSLAFLMTLFNVRLGWWMGNPRHRTKWLRHSPRLGLMYLTTDLTGSARDTSSYINLSDGGHFENLGLYELIRRRCRYIIICDSEEDQKFDFGGLGNAIRKCRTDFNVDVQLSLDNLRPVELGDHSRVHCIFGDIYYPGPERERGSLLYLKASLTGDDDPPDVREYGWENRSFPHQSTADQWFTESQFESYRELGHHIAEVAFAGIGPCPNTLAADSWLAGVFKDLQESWGTSPEDGQHQFEARMNINAAQGIYKLALNSAD